MRSALKIGFCCVLLGGMIAALWYRQRANDRLTVEIESLRRQTSDLGLLQADNQRLIAAAPDRAEAARKKREELGRLQAQISAWKNQIEGLERRREQASQRPAPTPRPETPLVPLPGMMTLGSIQNVGRDTPAHLAQTKIWAFLHQDWQALADMNAFEPEALAQFDAAFAKLSAAEQMKFGNPVRMATMLAFKSDESPPPPSAAQLAGPAMTVVAENVIGPDDVDVVSRTQISADKTRDHPPVRVHRFPDGWKFVPPPASAEERKVAIDAIPPTQRKVLSRD